MPYQEGASILEEETACSLAIEGIRVEMEELGGNVERFEELIKGSFCTV